MTRQMHFLHTLQTGFFFFLHWQTAGKVISFGSTFGHCSYCQRDRSLISLSQFFCSLTSSTQRFPGEEKLPFRDDFSSYLAILSFSDKCFWGWGSHGVWLVVVFPNEIFKIAGNKGKVGRMSKQGGAEWQPWQLTCKHSEIIYLSVICYSFSISLMSDSFMIYHYFCWLGIYLSSGLTIEQVWLAES